jgi:hypothetical protein
MSKTCGDTARFNRIRKQNINRRARIQALRLRLAAAAAPVAPEKTQGK